jgi:hypothetical protein
MPLPAAHVVVRLSCAALLLICVDAQAQLSTRAIEGVDVQKLANGVLGIMSYTVAPDVTTSSLALNSAATSSTDLSMSQFGGGFTWSKGTPLYLEGNAALSRYDPTFVASQGADVRSVPVKWNSFSATGGVGWDVPIADHWVVRPIFNFTFGYVASDLVIAKWWVENNTDLDLSFLDGGKLKAYGLGGSLMLDYEKFSPAYDDDLEIRYTNVDLRSYGNSSLGVQGRAKAESASVWARRRVPTGWGTVWDRPVRYVFEGAFTQFFGDETDTGLDRMSSIGFGLELDSSAKDIIATRWRLIARYKFGPSVTGYSVGMAISF